MSDSSTKGYEGVPMAFPCDRLQLQDGIHTSIGMTLRDYFAAKAIQAMVSSMYPKDSNHYDNKWYAENAYRIADAMLKARG